jgi:hypothetical protein
MFEPSPFAIDDSEEPTSATTDKPSEETETQQTHGIGKQTSEVLDYEEED